MRETRRNDLNEQRERGGNGKLERDGKMMRRRDMSENSYASGRGSRRGRGRERAREREREST